jgi:hypothetical protein
LGRSAIAIVEEDKRCFACTTFPKSGIVNQCIVSCHYNQRCYLKAPHANAMRKLLIVLCFPLLILNKSEKESSNELDYFFFVVAFFKSLIAVVRTSDGYVICSLMVVLHTMIIIGVCVQLIYVIPVISTLFVVSKTIDAWK